MNNSKMREAFLNQYAQSLIIDLNNFDQECLQNLIIVLKQVLALGCSIRGGNRIPAFELSILTSTFTKIFDLNVVKGNFNKISSNLNSLQTYSNVNENIYDEDYKDVLYLAINSTVLNFKSKLEKNELRLPNSKLEINIFVAKDERNIENYINMLLENLDVVYIQKINIVNIINNNETMTTCSQEKNLQVDTFVKNYAVDGRNLKLLKNYFKSWLTDKSNDVAAILHFPSQTTDINLKCDIHECILNPLALPFGHRFYLSNDSLGVQFIEMTSSSNISVFEVNIIARVSSESVCESTLYGLPFCLTPSKSWRLSYEEQISNEEYFYEICRQLGKNDKYLLGRLSPILLTDQFLPYFIFIPGNSCILVKSFASNDITMPWPEKNQPRSTTSFGNCASIHQTLQNLQQIENMSNTVFESGLTGCLVANLERTRTTNNFVEEREQSFAKKRKRINYKDLNL